MEQTIDTYLEWKAIDSESASRVYRSPLKLFNRIIEHNPLDQNDLVKFKYIATGEGYDNNYIAYIFHILKDYCGYLTALKVPCIDPFFINPPKYIRKQRDFVTESDFRQMMSVLNEWEYRDLTKIIALQLLWNTGMRVTELCNLTLADVSNDSKTTVIRTLKSKRFRYVKWSDEARELIIRYLGVRLTMSSNEALFVYRGEKLTVRTVQRWFKEICKRAGIEKHLTPHTVRHGFAHRVRDEGADVLALKELLGHSSINSCEHYIRLDAQESLRMVNKYAL